MGYKVKVQKIERRTNSTYYINFPSAIAESINLEKGEEMEWLIDGRNCFVLKRVKATESFRKKAAAKN